MITFDHVTYTYEAVNSRVSGIAPSPWSQENWFS